MKRKSNWLLYGGVAAVIGSALLWTQYPPFRRGLCNIGVIGTHFPPCKQEPGYVVPESEVPEGYDPKLASNLNSQIQMALGGGGPPTAAAFSRAYAGRRIGRRLPKLKHSR